MGSQLLKCRYPGSGTSKITKTGQAEGTVIYGQVSRQWNQQASQDWSSSVWTACTQRCAMRSGTTMMPEFTVTPWDTTLAEHLAPGTKVPRCLASCPMLLAVEMRQASLTVLSPPLQHATVAIHRMRRCFATLNSKVGWVLKQM